MNSNNFSREIITVSLGQCGIQTSAQIWRLYCLEHGIHVDGLMSSQPEDDAFMTFFRESNSGKFVPRAIMADLEATVCDNSIRNSILKDLFAPENVINSMEDAANVYARGKFVASKAIHPTICHQMRREMELCNQCNGIMIINASGGGTGSGYCTRFMESIENDIGKHCFPMSMTVVPSPNLFTSPVEPYNHLLWLQSNFINAPLQMSIMCDNEAMYKFIPQDDPTYWHVNQLIAHLASSFTAALRFDGELDCDITHMRTNLVPFKMLCHMIPRVGPFFNGRLRHSVQDITFDAFRSGKEFLSVDIRKGQYMSCGCLYRGLVLPRQVNSALQELKRELNFVSWSPTGFKVGLTSHPIKTLPGSPLEGVKRTLCKVSNNSAIVSMFNHIKLMFEAQLNNRAFVWAYTLAGMEEGEFMETIEKMEILTGAYRQATTTSDE